ncbi:MAG: (d)CMP kinase [Acidimicrobiia bacterium]|nr:(d)CMP kinase [Acidimicrobiia bacterium]
MKRVIAIDGPSGSGKSTVARAIAAVLGFDVLDTGAMYRAATLTALRHGIALDDGDAVVALVREVRIAADAGVVTLDGDDVSDEIRTPVVTSAVSSVAALPEVREELVGRQRAWLDRKGSGVVEGRDIGTVVFPDAAVKVYLTASEAERARRRQADESAARRLTTLDEEQHRLVERDRRDSTRATSPLARADDALTIDSTDLSVDEIVEMVLARWHQRSAPGEDGR